MIRDWLRNWLGTGPRGTLTFLANGTTLLGCPRGLAADEIERIRVQLGEWLFEPTRLLVLPFPIDVVDQRRRRP